MSHESLGSNTHTLTHTTNKTRFMLKYVNENMSTDFLVKCDEDVALRIDALYEMLGSIPQRQAVIGNIFVGYPVHRNTSKKWAKWAEQDYQVCYLSLTISSSCNFNNPTFPLLRHFISWCVIVQYDVYPPFPRGPNYILTGDVVAYLAMNMAWLKVQWFPSLCIMLYVVIDYNFDFQSTCGISKILQHFNVKII